MLFKEVIDEIVETDGINGITRARMLEVLGSKTDFTADGWMGDKGKDLRGFSDCFLIMQIEGGKFGYRLVRAELDFDAPGSIEAHCRIDLGETVVVPYSLVDPKPE